MKRRLGASWLCLAACVAQAPPRRRVHDDAATEPHLVRQQQEDGHWSAVAGGGEAEADLRVTALCLLAGLGDGSTLRMGPQRASLKKAVLWLRANQDRQGRYRLRGDPDWALDHAIATYAVVEAMRLSCYRTLATDVRAATGALADQLVVARPAADQELRLWAEMIVASLRAIGQAQWAHNEAGTAVSMDLAADALAHALAALPPPPPATTLRQHAAQSLCDELAGRPSSPPDWQAAPLQDPLASFYALVALFRAGGEPFAAATRQLQQTLLATQQGAGERRGSWDPVGEFGARCGREGTTAVASLLLEVHFRYCRLLVVGD